MCAAKIFVFEEMIIDPFLIAYDGCILSPSGCEKLKAAAHGLCERGFGKRGNERNSNSLTGKFLNVLIDPFLHFSVSTVRTYGELGSYS